MSQYINPPSVTAGLKFLFDPENIKSYRGPPIKNFLTQIEPRGLGDNGSTYRFFSGTEQVYIPTVGDVSSAYVDMYNDYNGGSNNCCPSPYGYGQGISVTGNTQYTYAILYKSYNRYTNANWMYHYEYTSGGSYITEYGVHMIGGYSGQETHLGDGWYWSRALFTTNANCSTINTGSWMYQYATWNRFYVAKVAILEGNWLHLHPKYWPDLNTTRTTTQTIQEPITKNTITATNLPPIFNGIVIFDGTTTHISAGSLTDISDFTIEIWFKSELVGDYKNPIDCNWLRYNGSYSNIGPRLEQNSSGNLVWIFGDTSGTYEARTVVTSGLKTAAYHCAVLTKNGNIYTSYYNGSLVQTGASGLTWPGNFNNIQIGRGFSTSNERWFQGTIGSVKLYNRALSSSEVLQNFNALQERFFGYQNLTWFISSNIAVDGQNTRVSTISKTGDDYSWNGQAIVYDTYTAPCTIEFTKQAQTYDNGLSYAMIGWNTDPTSNASYDTLDYASYPFNASGYEVYHNGSLYLGQGSGITWDPTKRFYISYDVDGYIRHWNESKLLYTSPLYGPNNVVYVDSSLYRTNQTWCKFENVKVCRRSWDGTKYV